MSITPASPAPVSSFVRRLRQNVETVIVGKRREIEYLLVALLCRGHVLVEDVPGTGKTMLARAVAASIGLRFTRLQCTPDLLPNDVTGLSVFNQQTQRFEFRSGPIMANILLADEINRATPRTQAALLEAMQERQVSVDGTTYPLPDPFFVIATQNPIELEGTFPLPEAQLDRFLLRLPLGYPEREDEIRMLRTLRKQHPIETIQQVVSGDELAGLYEIVADVHVDASLEQYLMDLVSATRSHPDVAVGVSPRGSLALYRAAQALAATRQRDFVLPDDVKEMAPLVLSHRIVITPESLLRGRTSDHVIGELLETVALDAEETG